MNQLGALTLAWVDFIPSLIFATGVYFLFRLVQQECGRPCAALTLGGGSLVFLSGIFKATWKLLFLAQVADLQVLNVLQFPLLALGFLLMCIGVVWFSRSGQMSPSGLLAIAAWKIPFLVIMVLSSLGMHGLLAFIAFRRRHKLAALGFVIAFIVVLGMGRLSGVEQSVRMQGLEEGLNSIGQLGFSLGCYLLYRQSARYQGPQPAPADA